MTTTIFHLAAQRDWEQAEAAEQVYFPPTFAQDQMNRTSCQEAYQRAADLISPNDATVGLQIQMVRITADGWCQFRAADPGVGELPFTSIDWRLQGSTGWTRDGIPPLAVQIRIEDFDEGNAQTRNRRLVLHFDLNNTILMKDSSKGTDPTSNTVQKNIQRIIAKSAWGRLTPAPETAQSIEVEVADGSVGLSASHSESYPRS